MVFDLPGASRVDFLRAQPAADRRGPHRVVVIPSSLRFVEQEVAGREIFPRQRFGETHRAREDSIPRAIRCALRRADHEVRTPVAVTEPERPRAQ